MGWGGIDEISLAHDLKLDYAYVNRHTLYLSFLNI